MSTSPDLVKYGNRIVDAVKRRPGSILSQQTLKEMWTKRTQNFPAFPWHPTNEYGYGWFIGHIPQTVNPHIKYRDFVWHSGGLMGVSTFLIKKKKLSIFLYSRRVMSETARLFRQLRMFRKGVDVVAGKEREKTKVDLLLDELFALIEFLLPLQWTTMTRTLPATETKAVTQ